MNIIDKYLINICNKIENSMLETENLTLGSGILGHFLCLIEYDNYNLDGYKINQSTLNFMFAKIEYHIMNISDFGLIFGVSAVLPVIDGLYQLGYLNENHLMYYKKTILAKLEYILNFENLDTYNEQDYLYGYLGSLYAIAKYTDNENLVMLLLNKIKNKQIERGDKIMWRDITMDQSRTEYDIINNPVANLGLAHGSAAVLAVLTRVYSKFPNTIHNIPLEKVYNYLKSTVFLDDKRFSKYPNIYADYGFEFIESRLGWCYGDLAVATAYLDYGSFTNNKVIREDAVDLVYFTLNRTLQNSGIIDTCLCHGSAGVALMYAKAYEMTLIEDFKIASNKYVDMIYIQIEESMKNGKNLLYFTTDYNTQLSEFREDLTLLNGEIGTALTLMHINKKSITNWQQLFFC